MPDVEVMAGPQADFVLSESRHPAMFSGRAGGKTTASVIKAFMYCFNYPGARGCLTEHSYKACERVLLPAIGKMFGAEQGRDWEFKAARMVIEFRNGSMLYFGYAEEPDSVGGLTLAFFGMDEAAIGEQHETFMVLQGSLRQECGCPLQGEERIHQGGCRGYPHYGWVTTTPAGIRHWLHQRWVQNQLSDGAPLPPDEYRIYRARTRENRFLSVADIESWERSYGDSRFARQELEGEFVAFEGAGFPDFDERTHVRNVPYDVQWKRKGLAGLDFGSIRPTAAIEIGVDSLGRAWALREFYKRQCDLPELLRALLEWDCRFLGDPTAKDLIEALKRSGLRIAKARSNSFKLRTGLVGGRIAVGHSGPGLFITPQCPNLIEELQTLTYRRQKGEGPESEAWASGLDDHAFDALSYALMEVDGVVSGRPQPAVILRRWGALGQRVA